MKQVLGGAADRAYTRVRLFRGAFFSKKQRHAPFSSSGSRVSPPPPPPSASATRVKGFIHVVHNHGQRPSRGNAGFSIL